MKKLILFLSVGTLTTFLICMLLGHKGTHALDDEELFEED